MIRHRESLHPMELTMETCLQNLRARGFSPRHVADIGASHGPWTTSAAALWPAARFTMFEPLAEHAPALDRLCAAQPNFSWFPCALGREKSSLPLSIMPGNLDIASLAYGGPESRTVPVESLDDLLAAGRISPADLVKIDVQGFEHEVLAGAGKFMSTVGVLIMETYFFRFSPQMKLFHEAVAVMHDHGFLVAEVIDPLRRPRDGAVGQCDICFIREGHPLWQSNSWN